MVVRFSIQVLGKGQMNVDEKILTVAELAERLRISSSKCYQLVSNGEIGHFRIGGCLRFAEHHIQEYLARVETKNSSKNNRPLKHIRI